MSKRPTKRRSPGATPAKPFIPEMLFVIREGNPIPKLPTAPDGRPRRADGKTLLNVRQASELTGRSEDALRRLYLEFWGEFVPAPDGTATVPAASPVIAPDPPRWWTKPGYRLEAVPCPRGQDSAELAAVSVFVVRDYADGTTRRAALLLAFLVGAPDMPAHRALSHARECVRDGTDGMQIWIDQRPDSVVDWRDQPEPADPLTTQIIPNGSDVPGEYWDTLQQFELLWTQMRKAPARLAPRVRATFDAVALHEDWQTHSWPPLPAMQRCIAIFHLQPEETKRQLLGGWASEAFQPWPREELGTSIGEKDLQCVLRCNIGRHFSWEFATVLDVTQNPVSINIKAGVSREDVLAALDYARADVEQRWAQLVTDPESFPLDDVEKQGAQPITKPMNINQAHKSSRRKAGAR